MAFSIPDEGNAAFAAQAEPDAVDFDILTAGFAGTGFVSGCAVTAQGSPDMTLAVAAGIIRVGGTSVTVTAGNVTITTAHATLPRFDLVVVNNSGTKSVVAGTAAALPLFPAIPANSVVLAAVYVPATDTAIGSTQIIDKRVPGELLSKDSVGDVTLPSPTWGSGGLAGGNIRHATGILIDNAYTQSESASDVLAGIGVRVRWNPTVNFSGIQTLQTGWFGPGAAFHFEGASVFKFNAGLFSFPGIAFGDFHVHKNFPGTALTLTPAWGYVGARFFVADGAVVTGAVNDTLDGPSEFIDTSVWITANGGTYAGTALTMYSFASQPLIGGATHLAGRIAFEVRDYQNAVGNLGGQTLTVPGGTAMTFDNSNATVDLQIGLRVPRLAHATTNVGIRCVSLLELWQDTATFTALPSPVVEHNGVFTLDVASATWGPVVEIAPTVKYKQAANIFGAFNCFRATPVITNHTSLSGAYIGLNTMWYNNPTFRADTNAMTASTLRGFVDKQQFDSVNSGSLVVASVLGFAAELVVGANSTVTSWTGFHVSAAGLTGNGAVTTQIGVDIDSLSTASTSIGLRNASTTVHTPTTKTITATTDAITPSASTIRLNNTSGSSKTLASTPTIANGQDGQEILLTNTSSNDVVLQDQGTLASSNLRLGAATRTLSQRDSIRLKYDGTVGDWLELSFSNVL